MRTNTLQKAAILCSVYVMLIHHVRGHGRLMEPPARNAMWRFGFPNPVNYNDNGKESSAYDALQFS